MRVITGSARGTKLSTLAGNDVRPTAEQVKEALFSSIHFQLEGSTVLDLFAGSGQLGIEALSRGAEFAVFCDSSKAAADIIEKNLQACHFGKDRYHLHKGDFSSLLRTTAKKFDFCFLDPPYNAGLYEEAFKGLENVMKDDGVILCEHPKELPFNDTYGAFVKVKDYRFSRIIISKYVFKDNV